jgi:hypothetical protein
MTEIGPVVIWAFVNIITNIKVLLRADNFMTSRMAIGFLGLSCTMEFVDF